MEQPERVSIGGDSIASSEYETGLSLSLKKQVGQFIHVCAPDNGNPELKSTSILVKGIWDLTTKFTSHRYQEYIYSC